MLKSKLAGLEVRLEGLADKLEFAQEDIVVQLQQVTEELYKALITMDTTQGWMEKRVASSNSRLA